MGRRLVWYLWSHRLTLNPDHIRPAQLVRRTWKGEYIIRDPALPHDPLTLERGRVFHSRRDALQAMRSAAEQQIRQLGGGAEVLALERLCSRIDSELAAAT